MIVNHIIRSGHDLQLAMIEGTEVLTRCGIWFIPTVTVGTSGRADIPGNPQCADCDRALELLRQWSRLKDEKNRMLREMRTLERQHRELISGVREKRSEPQEVNA